MMSGRGKNVTDAGGLESLIRAFDASAGDWFRKSRAGVPKGILC